MNQGTETCGDHQNASGDEINVTNEDPKEEEVGLMFIIPRMMLVNSFLYMPWHHFCLIKSIY